MKKKLHKFENKNICAKYSFISWKNILKIYWQYTVGAESISLFSEVGQMFKNCFKKSKIVGKKDVLFLATGVHEGLTH